MYVRIYLNLRLYAFFLLVFFPTFLGNLLDLGHQKKMFTIFFWSCMSKNYLAKPADNSNTLSIFSSEPTLLAPKAAVVTKTTCCCRQGNSQSVATTWNTTYLTHNCMCIIQLYHTWSCSKGNFLSVMHASKQHVLWNPHLAMLRSLTIYNISHKLSSQVFQSVRSHMHASDSLGSSHAWLLVRADHWWKAWVHAHLQTELAVSSKQNKHGSVHHSYPISCCIWLFGLTLNSFHFWDTAYAFKALTPSSGSQVCQPA